MKSNLTLEQLPNAVHLLSQKLDSIERLLIEENEKEEALKEDVLMTIEEASEFLHLTKSTIYSKVSRGELPYMKQSKRLYFFKNDLIQHLKDGKKSSIDELNTVASNFLNNKKG